MVVSIDPMTRLGLNLTPPLAIMTADQFFDFCQANSELRIERTAEGDMIIMPPAGTESGGRNLDLAVSFGIWARADGTGKGFDSSTGFTLPNGAVRSPDLAWIRLPRWQALSAEERVKFAPICPDFVVELRSPSDRPKDLQEKLEEYIANGAELGWLIDPIEREVHVYRPGQPVECLSDPTEVAGDPVLPGFVLKLAEIWG
jgi:Uma2 family endonuclease